MAPLKKPQPRQQEKISPDRAIKASLLTFLSLVLLILWGYHALWAIKVFVYNRFGGILNNTVYGVGTLVANAGISIKAVTWLNDKWLEDKLDADHKKYI